MTEPLTVQKVPSDRRIPIGGQSARMELNNCNIARNRRVNHQSVNKTDASKVSGKFWKGTGVACRSFGRTTTLTNFNFYYRYYFKIKKKKRTRRRGEQAGSRRKKALSPFLSMSPAATRERLFNVPGDGHAFSRSPQQRLALARPGRLASIRVSRVWLG